VCGGKKVGKKNLDFTQDWVKVADKFSEEQAMDASGKVGKALVEEVRAFPGCRGGLAARAQILGEYVALVELDEQLDERKILEVKHMLMGEYRLLANELERQCRELGGGGFVADDVDVEKP